MNKIANKKGFVLLLSVVFVISVIPAMVAADSSPFATEVVSSSGPFGWSPYDDPDAVLGKPSTRVGGPWGGRIKIVEPAWGVSPDGEKLITTLSEGSQITVTFDHQVEDDPNNPYGIDLLVFGNSFFGCSGWANDGTDMNTCMLGRGCFSEPIKVSVSQDGENWYTYDGGPYADTMFPTQAYLWDRENAKWTDIEMDWTKPVDPPLTLDDFAYISAADAIDLYDGSAGGTGFDLAESGYEWIQYVRVQGVSGFSGGEIDAFADVAPEVCPVPIDIKPGSFPNSINPNSPGVIPVAILTTDNFDATAVDASTVRFGPAEAQAVHSALEDVDNDGDVDMILHFRIQETGITAGDTEATLTGKTVDGMKIVGTDSVSTVPSNK